MTQHPPRRRRKWLRIILISLVTISLLIAIGGFIVYQATQAVPDFYTRALKADPVLQETASDEMLQKVTTLANDLKRKGRWEARFTEEQINGWMAVDMLRNHPDLLPASFTEPRVVIQPEAVSLACRFGDGTLKSVLNLSIDPYMAEPNVLAIRIRRARAGALPLPLNSLLEKISSAVEKMDHQVEWTQTEGDPVALISIKPLSGEVTRKLILDDIRLGDGEIYLSGTSIEEQ